MAERTCTLDETLAVRGGDEALDESVHDRITHAGVVPAARNVGAFRGPIFGLLVPGRQRLTPATDDHVEIERLHALLVLGGVNGPHPRANPEVLEVLGEGKSDALELRFI